MHPGLRAAAGTTPVAWRARVVASDLPGPRRPVGAVVSFWPGLAAGALILAGLLACSWVRMLGRMDRAESLARRYYRQLVGVRAQLAEARSLPRSGVIPEWVSPAEITHLITDPPGRVRRYADGGRSAR